MIESDVAHNGTVMVAVLIYCVSAVALGDFLVGRKALSKDVSRKMVHIAAGCWLLWWPLFRSSHWSWRLNAGAPLIFAVKLLAKGLLGVSDPKSDPDVAAMTRTGDPKELLAGPLYFALVMAAVGLLLFRDERAFFIMACLGFGDGLAPLAGSRFGAKSYSFRFLGRPKTLAGSLACFVGSVGGMYLFSALGHVPSLEWQTAVGTAALATAVEAVAPSDWDNVLIPLSVFGFLTYGLGSP